MLRTSFNFSHTIFNPNPQATVDIGYKIVLENAWLGYNSLRDVNYDLAAFGLIDPYLYNFLSTYNFLLYSRNQNQGMNWIDEKNQEFEKLINHTKVDLNNPVKSQLQLNISLNNSQTFLGVCNACKAYIAVEKENWQFNNTVKALLVNEYYNDYRYLIDQTTNKFYQEVYLLQGSDC